MLAASEKWAHQYKLSSLSEHLSCGAMFSLFQHEVIYSEQYCDVPPLKVWFFEMRTYCYEQYMFIHHINPQTWTDDLQIQKNQEHIKLVIEADT